MGNSLKDIGSLDEALESYNVALRIDSSYAEAYNNIGVAFKDKGDLDVTIDKFNQAININVEYAEAYYNMGLVLKDKGNLEEAIASYRKAIKIKPNFVQAHYHIGNALFNNGQLELAINSYKSVLKIKPDHIEARYLLASLEGETINFAPRAYVENLFDGYAHKFERSLVEELECNIHKIITKISISKSCNGLLGSVLDLGCGTGLVGSEIRGFCTWLESIDISTKMLQKAKEKNIYDKLTHINISDYLSRQALDFDYLIAADVFIYVGDLSSVFKLIKACNKPNGRFIFSTEHNDKDSFYFKKRDAILIQRHI